MKNEKKIIPSEKKLCRKNLNPIEKNLDDCVSAIAMLSDGDREIIEEVKNLLEEIQYCNRYKMYYVRDLAIDRAIRRCEFELDFINIDPNIEPDEFEEAVENLQKKHFGYLS